MDKVVQSILKVVTDHLKTSRPKKSSAVKKKKAEPTQVNMNQVVNVENANPADQALNRLKGNLLL